MGKEGLQGTRPSHESFKYAGLGFQKEDWPNCSWREDVQRKPCSSDRGIW